MDESWQQLDNYQVSKFIEEVKDKDFLPLFESSAYALWRRPLSFFDGYAHYVLENRAMVPHFALDYISNGENHYYLDGSEHPLELLSRRGALRLREDKVLDYLAFFSEIAFYPYRKVKFITDPKKTPYKGASAMGHHFKSLKSTQAELPRYSEAEQSYRLSLPLLYNGETLKGEVEVKKTGEINILKPVYVPLLDRSRQHAALHYSHPHEEKVLAENLDILQQSETGRALMERTLGKGAELRIISGVQHSLYAPKSMLAYVIAPQNIDTYSPYQMIDIALALKDLDLRAQGYSRGHPDDDDEEFIEANAAYNLEIIMDLCKIVHELTDADFTDILPKFRNDGYEKLYSAYINKASKEEMYAMVLGTIYIYEEA